MNKIQKEQLCLKISKIFTRLHYKTNFTMRNTSSQLLPTDLLRDNSKRKLFQIVAFKLVWANPSPPAKQITPTPTADGNCI